MIEYHKINQIVSIKITDLSVSRYLYVEPYIKKSFWGISKTIDGGYMDSWYPDSQYYTEETVLNIKDYNGQLSFIKKNGVIYNRSSVYIKLRDGGVYKYFDTFEESKKYVEDLIEKNNLSDSLIQF